MPGVSGHVQVRQGARGRVWVALWRDADGRHKKTLGPAWVKPYGKTARGATKWRAADGSRPAGHLTPKEAEAELRSILAAALTVGALEAVEKVSDKGDVYAIGAAP
jgi:hypothetical protein